MAFLTLNGITVPVAQGGEVAPQQIGDSARALDGTMLRERRAIKRRWRFITTPLEPLTARMIRELILGSGRHFPLDTNTESSGGVVATSEVSVMHRSNTAADGNPVYILYNPPDEFGNVAVRDGAADFHLNTINKVTLDQADAEGTPASDYTSEGGATLATDTVHFWEGTQSAKCTTTGGITEGISVNIAVSFTQNYICSVYIYVKSGITDIRLEIENDDVGSTIVDFNVGIDDGWYRIWAEHTTGGSTTILTMKVLDISQASGGVFSTDGWQMELKQYLSPWSLGTRSSISKLVYGPQVVSGITAESDGFSISAWANGTEVAFIDATDAYIAELRLSASTSNNKLGIFYRDTDAYPVAAVIGSSGTVANVVAGSATDPYGQWHHYVATYERTPAKMTFYRDGVLVGSTAPSFPIDFSDIANSSAGIGGNAAGTAGSVLGGAADDVLFLPYSLTAAAASGLYTSLSSPPGILLPGLILSGDCTRDTEATVFGSITREMYSGVQRTAWENANMAIDFILEEV